MIAVSKTTPLRYLIAIGQERVFGNLFDKVLVPHAVHEELTDPRTPEFVRRRVLTHPARYEVCAVSENQTIPVSVLLIDDQAGRTIALGRGLPPSGALGILERADEMGFIEDFPTVLDDLKASGFFVAEFLAQRMIKRHSARRGIK